MYEYPQSQYPYEDGYHPQQQQQQGSRKSYEGSYTGRTHNTNDNNYHIHTTDHTERDLRKSERIYRNRRANASVKAGMSAAKFAFLAAVLIIALTILLPLLWSFIQNMTIIGILVCIAIVLYALVPRLRKRNKRSKMYPKD